MHFNQTLCILCAFIIEICISIATKTFMVKVQLFVRDEMKKWELHWEIVINNRSSMMQLIKNALV